MHAGRTWASDTVTALQDKVLCRAMVLLTTIDEDLIRHAPPMPDVAPPDGLVGTFGQAFPGAELRLAPGDDLLDGVPLQRRWHRFGEHIASPAAAQAIVSWATCGNVIGLAMRPHRDVVGIDDAHLTVSTGVIAHTMHFLDCFDVSDWLLIEEQATMAGSGRVYGSGRVFTASGQLVATFQQDSMAKRADGRLDPTLSL
jgi:acyl-CoA thioesterase